MTEYSLAIVFENFQFFIKPPFYEYYADPFILRRDDYTVWVLFERYNRFSKIGVIDILCIDFKNKTYNIKPLIKERFHLSFPFPFFFEGSLYVIPESTQNNSLIFYSLDRGSDGNYSASKVQEIPGYFADPVIYKHPSRGYLLRYYTGKSVNDGSTCEAAIHLIDGGFSLGEINQIGIYRPGGFVSADIFPVQRCDAAYGFGLIFIDERNLPIRFNNLEIEFSLKTNSHHFHENFGVFTFDLTKKVSSIRMAKKSHFFQN